MRNIILLLLVLVIPSKYLFASKTMANGDFYQIKVYHLKNDEQEKVVDDYLKQAYLPALHRAGITKVGVFKPIKASGTEKTDEKLVYVFIPFPSYEAMGKLGQTLEKDRKFMEDGKAYLDAVYNKPPYDRLETILINAFEDSPRFSLPKLTSPMKDRVYELRSYESPTEKLHVNKVKMFNKGDEIGLFKRLNFNAVFYGSVVAGGRMPNLMYLTTFENKADRDAHWDKFTKDEYWKKLSAMPEYQNNVSKNDTRFLYPTDYSDI